MDTSLSRHHKKCTDQLDSQHRVSSDEIPCITCLQGSGPPVADGGWGKRSNSGSGRETARQAGIDRIPFPIGGPDLGRESIAL